MFETIAISVLIVAISVILLAIQMLLKKKGNFPDLHISNNQALYKRKVYCAQVQDRKARLQKRWKVVERTQNNQKNTYIVK